MSDITTEGMAIAPGVVETIVTLAVREVAGVESVGTVSAGIRAFLSNKPSTQGVVVTADEDGSVAVEVSINVLSGYSLKDIVNEVRASIADALLSQVGLSVSRVDIRVDGIHFQD